MLKERKAGITLNLKFFKNVSILTLIGMLIKVIGAIYRVPLTQIIGNEGNGYYGSAHNIYTMILLISSTSIPMAVSKLLSSQKFKKEEKQEVFQCMIIYAFVFGFLGSSICFLFAPIFTIGNPNAIPVLRMFAPTIFFSAIMGTFRGYFQSKREMKPTAFSQLFEQLANACFSVGCSYLLMKLTSNSIWGAVGAAVGPFMGVLFGCIYLIFLYRKQHLPWQKESYCDHRMIYRSLFFTIIPMVLSTLIHNVGSTIDMTMFYNIEQWKGQAYEELNAWYGIYSGQFLVLYHVPTALATSISVAIMPMISGSKKEDQIKHTKEAFQLTCTFLLPCMIGFMFLSRTIISVLFPQDPSSETLSAQFLFFGSIALFGTCFTTLSTTILQGLNYMKAPVKNMAIALSVQSVMNLCLFLFTDLGIYVFLMSTITFSAMTFLLNFHTLSQAIAWKPLLLSSLKYPLIGNIVMLLYLICVYNLNRIVSFSELFYLCIQMIGSIVIYGGIQFFLQKKSFRMH